MTATVFVLFGATGDLAHRMVLPAFFELVKRDLVPKPWVLIGNGRGDHPDEEFQEAVRASLADHDDAPNPEDVGWDDVAAQVRFAGGGFDEDDPGSLLDVIAKAREELSDGTQGEGVQLIHYLALPPTVFQPITAALAKHELLDEGTRVVYEKPYGTSPESFQELDDAVHSVMAEEQVFRIDHFLGKEATQDLHVLRFANQLFAGVWNREHVEEVQIDIPETLDIDDRAVFYDATGAARDMIVTHLFQVAAEIAMEPPLSLGAEDLQAARESVVSAFRPLAAEDVIRGQYQGYLDVKGVAEGSTTETFVAARLWIDTDRWRDVPFVLRTGKRMTASGQQISLVMRKVEGPVKHQPDGGNVIRFALNGSGALDLDLTIKEPGAEFRFGSGTAALDLNDVKGGDPLPPYAKLLHDVLEGDRSLFTTGAGLREAWRASAAVLADPPPVLPYDQGSWGPAAADELPLHGWVFSGTVKDDGK